MQALLRDVHANKARVGRQAFFFQQLLNATRRLGILGHHIEEAAAACTRQFVACAEVVHLLAEGFDDGRIGARVQEFVLRPGRTEQRAVAVEIAQLQGIEHLHRVSLHLIEEGKVFIAETPLYEINTKDQVWFAYTEKEKTQALEEIGNQKYTIQRSKGLGENEADMMWMTTMNPKTRRLVEILPEDAERTAQIFDMLLGDNLVGRKEHIADNGHLYIDMLDLS